MFCTSNAYYFFIPMEPAYAVTASTNMPTDE